ncbi:MAG: DUF2946 family protein [Rhodocyclaceae bacterium]|nr:DUF2946 family protein [Rhodocyclaceae bacterium]
MSERHDELQGMGAAAPVLRALALWPNVPDCYGWLYLDRRGNWRLGKEREPVRHAGLTAAIGANYYCTGAGCFFQNGPQRVWVELEMTPYVLRLADAGGERFVTHNGLAVTHIREAWLDAGGNLGLVSEHGAGIVDDRDLARLCEQLYAPDGAAAPDADSAAWLQLGATRLPLTILPPGRSAAMHFGFVTQPQAAPPGP